MGEGPSEKVRWRKIRGRRSSGATREGSFEEVHMRRFDGERSARAGPWEKV